MAATTLPLSFQRTYNAPSASTSYDEFGIHSIPAAAPSMTSWDEQVVPALRKKLEAESKRLDHRIESTRGQPVQTRQQIKPVRRLDRAHEIIQDGLGSDDLIPSGWATGSSAQFASIAPRAKIQAEDRLRSASAHHQTYKSHDYYPQPQAESPPSTVIRDSPSPSRGTSPQNVSQAREKARRLAREREVLGYGQRLSPSSNDLQDEWVGEHLESRDTQRVRTVSSPALQNGVGTDAGAIPSLPAVLPRKASKTNYRNEDVAKTQIPASKSMPRTQDENAVQPDMRKTKSAARLNAKKNQDDSNQYSSRSKASPLRPLQNNAMSNERVLDEFGPLGGTPTKRGIGGEGNENDFRNQRSVSNPWDEEMIPTVKKRLEQQRMMEGLSRDDEIVDIWDRNGLPLSKRQVSVKHRASEGMSPSKSVQEKDRSVDEESEKMRQLHEQLDLGGIANESSVSYDSQSGLKEHTQRKVEDRSDQHYIEMQDINRPMKQRQEQIQEQGREEQHQYQYPSQSPPQQQQEQQSHNAQRLPANQTAGTMPIQEPILAEVDAGCCKCTVM
jgi:hypothetical protein